MRKNILIPALFLIVFTSLAQAQNVRIKSLGGIIYGLDDRDNSLNPYDFGSNPAWLINDEKETWLNITPSYGKTWGDYKRLYDYKSADEEGISFTGVKPLGENGTFLGRATYSNETRKDVYRSLEYSPYGGEAFFITDTTMGNFRYDGPAVGFIYSFELLPGLFTGVEANYQLLDGLKNIYSAAKSLYRDVNGKLGLAYKFSDGLVLGLDFELLDTQEALEMKDALGQNYVEIFNYRGETYSTFLRRLIVNEKIRKQGEKFGAQIYYRPLENFETALKADYALSETKFFIPSDYLMEFEESFATFESYNFALQARYRPLRNLTLGGSISYLKDDSWTKNPDRALMLWKWNVNRTILGAGATYKIEPLNLMLALDLEAGLIKTDSSKYIDLKFHKFSAFNNVARLGAEYEFPGDFFLRAGYSIGKNEADLISGGRNVAVNYATFGLAFRIFETAKIDFMMQYGNESPLGYTHYSRDHFSAAATIRLNTF